MNELCKNCEYFKPMAIGIDRNAWGLCSKFAGRSEGGKGKQEAVFRWGDAMCSEFKPAKQPVRQFQ